MAPDRTRQGTRLAQLVAVSQGLARRLNLSHPNRLPRPAAAGWYEAHQIALQPWPQPYLLYIPVAAGLRRRRVRTYAYCEQLSCGWRGLAGACVAMESHDDWAGLCAILGRPVRRAVMEEVQLPLKWVTGGIDDVLREIISGELQL